MKKSMTDRKARKVLIINNIKSETIDQAIFILKGDTGTKSQTHLDKSVATEAQAIIDRYVRQVERLKGEHARSSKTKKAVRGWPLLLLLVSFASVLVSVILSLTIS